MLYALELSPGYYYYDSPETEKWPQPAGGGTLLISKTIPGKTTGT
jgi:hypothetical protein